MLEKKKFILLDVYVGGGFVQYEYLVVSHQRSGQADQLLLADAEIGTALGHLTVQTAG